MRLDVTGTCEKLSLRKRLVWSRVLPVYTAGLWSMYGFMRRAAPGGGALYALRSQLQSERVKDIVRFEGKLTKLESLDGEFRG